LSSLLVLVFDAVLVVVQAGNNATASKLRASLNFIFLPLIRGEITARLDFFIITIFQFAAASTLCVRHFDGPSRTASLFEENRQRLFEPTENGSQFFPRRRGP
jgi:hypothetical protein